MSSIKNKKKYISFNEKIFIAGSTGMVGQAIKRNLLKNGYGNEENGGSLLTPSREKLNLINYDDVKNWFKLNRPSIVVLAAAKVGGILANISEPTEFILDNLKIQTNVIENAWKFGVKRLLFLGSSCIYPKYSNQPIEEESLLTNSLEETNQYYAIAKIAGIKLCEALRRQYKFDAISLMPTNLYGPGDNYHDSNSHVMASLIKKFYFASRDNHPSLTCWGTGSPLREFMHVDDLGNAVVFALENWYPEAKGAPLDEKGNPLYLLNVGTGKDISIKDLALKISKITSFKGEIIWDSSKPNGTPKKQLNVEKFREMGWEPKIQLEEGIRKTLVSFKEENL